MAYGRTAHNTRLAQKCHSAFLGSAKRRSGFALCGILLHHILPALQTYGLLIRAGKTSPTLNVRRNNI